MRINNYNLILDENRIPSLVKENSKNYPELTSIKTPEDAVNIVNTVFKANIQCEEHLYMIALRSNCIIGLFEISHGTINASPISPKEVFTRLLLASASAFLILHNHPSGNISPSKEDFEVTKRLKSASDIMSIKFLDHIIVGENDCDYFSFLRNGNLDD